MRDIPAFVMNASNVYRTRDYIVKQAIEIQHDSVEAGNVFSYDTFYIFRKICLRMARQQSPSFTRYSACGNCS